MNLNKKFSKKTIRIGVLVANFLVLGLVASAVVHQDTSRADSVVSSSVDGSLETASSLAVPLDQVSSADIAVNVARVAKLPEVNSVTNRADSINVAAAMVTADTSVVAKPQVVSDTLPSKRDITTYKVDSAISISDLSSKTGVSSDSIRWSNNLTGNEIPAGTTLVLPPPGVSGVVYTVKEGDTPDSLASKYLTDKEKIIQFNDAEVGGLKVGEKILIPGGVIQAPVVVASSPAASTSTTFAWGGNAPIYSANGYDYGWCTWHAANRRREIGRPIPSNLGNAISWYYIAKSSGMAVGDTPAAGAVLWHGNIGGWGHVAFVEAVNPDGSILVSDMNYPIWGTVTYRTVQPSEFGSLKFIY